MRIERSLRGDRRAKKHRRQSRLEASPPNHIIFNYEFKITSRLIHERQKHLGAGGTPCVSSKVTGIPEVVRHNDTGLLVPEQQPELLAGGIRQLLTDSELRVRLASAARKLIEEQFDIEHNTAKLRNQFAASRSEIYEPSLAEVG